MILRFTPALIILLLVVPVAAGLVLATLPAFGYLPVLGGEHFTLLHWQRFFASPGITQSLGVSYFAGLVTTALSLAIVLSFLAASRGTVFDRWIFRLVSPLLSVPHAAAAFGLAFLIMPSGLISRWISPGLSGWERPPDLLIVNDTNGLALIAGLVIKEIPFILLMSMAALSQINADRRIMMARSLGYRPALAWLKVVAPALYPLIRLPVYAVLAYGSSTVDIAMILGPTLPATLSVRVVQWFNDPDLSMRFLASAGALAQLGLTAAALLTWWLLEQLAGWFHGCWVRGGSRRGPEGLLGATGRLLMLLSVAAAVLSLLALVINALAGFWRFPSAWPAALTLNNIMEAAPSLGGPLYSTLIIAVLSTLVATVLVLLALEREQRQGGAPSWAIWLLYLPLLVPQIAFLSGITVSAEFLQGGPSIGLVAAGHLLFVLPYVYLALSASYQRLDPRWSRVARSLGCSMSSAFWRVRLPLLLAPVLVAMALGFAISVSQYLPTRLLGAGRITTVTTEAVALSAGGDRRLIGVWALVQALLPFIGFALATLVPAIVWRRRQGMQGIR